MSEISRSPQATGAQPPHPPNKKVGIQVQCPGFRCLAYRDEDGNWRGYYNHKIISDVLGVVAEPPGDPPTSKSH